MWRLARHMVILVVFLAIEGWLLYLLLSWLFRVLREPARRVG
jgi:hypothetical protein